MGEGAVREVAQVYERIKIQHPLLLHYSSSHHHQPTTQLAHNLLSDALRALNLALSVMKQHPAAAAGSVTPRIVQAAEPQISPPSPASADPQAIVTSTARSGKRRRSSVMLEGKKSSWVNFTTVPYEDGYEWRKYGEKKINGTSYTRSYFRCTYKDDTGCLATKHVQQKDCNSDPPMFQVTYNNGHTCKNFTTTTAANNNSGSSNNLALIGCCNSSEGVTKISSRNNGHAGAAMNNIKQEQPPVLLPPILEISALPFDGKPPSMTSSCISGESWDEYSAGDMAQIAEASAGDDLLYDPELFVLCTSFKVY
ncbi:hypothetical protein SETIT_8G013000v2 [Setaria italica]|uniref:WRKY domain-containing protein n=1 Tax=Setaria italica TaxID=4555 RepID=K3ZJB7_SETIT|nr:probable WRKY transcription factor 54 [Setaria italica]RCV36826.1 hypothetical protein SETIT_8G013000v2 [Setaria italica]